jgi:hypothetical protein
VRRLHGANDEVLQGGLKEPHFYMVLSQDAHDLGSINAQSLQVSSSHSCGSKEECGGIAFYRQQAQQ